MTRIVIDCADPNDLEALANAAEQVAGKCNVTYANHAKALMDAGAVKSERAAARKIAEETGEKPETVRKMIQRGKSEMGTGVPKKTHTELEPRTPQPVTRRGGKRKVSQAFLQGLNNLSLVVGLEKRNGWRTLSQESAQEMIQGLLEMIQNPNDPGPLKITKRPQPKPGDQFGWDNAIGALARQLGFIEAEIDDMCGMSLWPEQHTVVKEVIDRVYDYYQQRKDT